MKLGDLIISVGFILLSLSFPIQADEVHEEYKNDLQEIDQQGGKPSPDAPGYSSSKKWQPYPNYPTGG